MTNLPALIARLEAATKGSVALSCAYADALGLPPGPTAAFTTSLDAIVALIERELPGCEFQLVVCVPGVSQVILWPAADKQPSHSATHKSAPIALCISLCRAITTEQAQEPTA